MNNPEPPVTTEITVAGANCAICFNDTLESLRAESGVVAVHGSTTSQCLRVDHRDVEIDRLVTLVRQHLHGEDVSSSERVMVAIDPQVAELHCDHGQHRPATAGGSASQP